MLPRYQLDRKGVQSVVHPCSRTSCANELPYFFFGLIRIVRGETHEPGSRILLVLRAIDLGSGPATKRLAVRSVDTRDNYSRIRFGSLGRSKDGPKASVRLVCVQTGARAHTQRTLEPPGSISSVRTNGCTHTE